MTLSGGSTLDASAGSVGIWFNNSDNNTHIVNFTGAGTIVGRLGYKDTFGGASDNNYQWSEAWTEGILKYNGTNTGAFADHFSTTGTAGTAGYKLIAVAVPEPSSTALLGLGGLALILRRRK